MKRQSEFRLHVYFGKRKQGEKKRKEKEKGKKTEK
jgi:hypothetical protein